MKRPVFFIASAVVVLIVVAAITCPDRKSHCEAMTDAICEVMKGDDYKDQAEKFCNWIGINPETELKDFVGTNLDGKITSDSYLVFSLGKIDGQTVSLGIFGHVFTAGKEDISKAVNDFAAKMVSDYAEEAVSKTFTNLSNAFLNLLVN